jgi:hypothetical protein
MADIKKVSANISPNVGSVHGNTGTPANSNTTSVPSAPRGDSFTQASSSLNQVVKNSNQTVRAGLFASRSPKFDSRALAFLGDVARTPNIADRDRGADVTAVERFVA